MQVQFDPAVLKKLGNMQPGDSFDLKYVVGIDGGGGVEATLSLRLDDPHGLFAGHSVMAVLGNLLAQVIAAKIE